TPAPLLLLPSSTVSSPPNPSRSPPTTPSTDRRCWEGGASARSTSAWRIPLVSRWQRRSLKPGVRRR
ncbi:hypothetical protein CRUP_017553, partial [Coryphaenoides rupestris]